jgi:hypothetical protein
MTQRGSLESRLSRTERLVMAVDLIFGGAVLSLLCLGAYLCWHLVRGPA